MTTDPTKETVAPVEQASVSPPKIVDYCAICGGTGRYYDHVQDDTGHECSCMKSSPATPKPALGMCERLGDDCFPLHQKPHLILANCVNWKPTGEHRGIDLVAKAASGGRESGPVRGNDCSVPSPAQPDYNRAYQFMHAWLLNRNPKYANHKLTVRMRRNRLAELLCEYATYLGEHREDKSDGN